MCCRIPSATASRRFPFPFSFSSNRGGSSGGFVRRTAFQCSNRPPEKESIHLEKFSVILKGVLLFAFDVLVRDVCLCGEAGGDQVEDLTDSLYRNCGEISIGVPSLALIRG